MKNYYFNILFICLGMFVSRAQVTLVKDINQGITGSGPNDLFEFGGELFFTAGNSTFGRELHKYNATTDEVTFIQDSNPGIYNSFLEKTLEYNGDLYLTFENGGFGHQFYKYETASQTLTLIPDIYVEDMIVYNDKIFMNARNPYNTFGYELYSFDSTNNVVELVSDIDSGSKNKNSSPDEFIIFNNKLYFSATSEILGRELYEYDAATDVTRLVKNINTNTIGNKDGTPREFTIYNNELYFGAFNTTVGYELFKYDPVLDDVVLVVDIMPGVNQSALKDIFLHNNKLYYQASNDSNIGVEFHSFDAATGVDTLVREIAATATGSYPTDFYSFNNKLFFSTSVGVSSLFVYNDVTDVLTQLAPEGATSLRPTDIIEFENKLFIAGQTEVTNGSGEEIDAYLGRELYVYDDVSVSLVADISSGFSSSEINYLTIYNNELYFKANNSVVGNELFKYNSATASIKKFDNKLIVKHYNNTIYIGDKAKLITTKIYDVLGKSILQTNENKISTLQFKKGTYFAVIRSENKIQTFKFIAN